MEKLENINFDRVPDGEDIEIEVNDDLFMLIKGEPFITFKSYNNSISKTTFSKIFTFMRRLHYILLQTSFYSDDYNAEMVFIKDGN